MQLRDHSVHCGDHRAELRHEEHVHDGGRGQREVHRHPGGNDKLVHACNALLGVDEQPFPIERDDLHLDRFLGRGNRFEGIEIVGSDPDHAAEKQDDQDRNAPDNRFDTAGIDEIGTIACPGIGRAKPPGEDQDRDDRGDHDYQHDAQRVEQDFCVRRADRPLRVQHAA